MSQVVGRPSDAAHVTESPGGSIETEVELGAILPNRLQPRRKFDEASLSELAESIKSEGVLQPLLVVKEETGYMLIAGERRLRAARLAGLKTAPVRTLPSMSDEKLLQLALMENLQREDLNPIETAQAYHQLMERYNMTQADISKQIGKSRSAVANSLRLLGLSDQVKQYVAEGKLSEGHARALLALSDPKEQLLFARKAIDDTLTVRHMEHITHTARKPRGRRLAPRYKDIDIIEAENRLKQTLQAPVTIKAGLKRGKIEIHYSGVSDLNRLLDVLQTAHN
ncbi:MAG: ParB/RepB/Spo0J family partition protein [Candidatus Zixiibacteriota bacterium]